MPKLYSQTTQQFVTIYLHQPIYPFTTTHYPNTPISNFGTQQHPTFKKLYYYQLPPLTPYQQESYQIPLLSSSSIKLLRFMVKKVTKNTKNTKNNKPTPKQTPSARSISKVPTKNNKNNKKKILKKPRTIITADQRTILEAKQFEANWVRRQKLRGKKVNPTATKLSIVRPAIKSKPLKTKTNPKKARSTPALLPSPPLRFSAPATILPPPPKRRTNTGGSKVSTGSRTNLKHDPTLPLPQFGVIDICFCIDATGSMTSYLAESKKTVIDIINSIEAKVQTEGIQLRFAVVTYRDHPPQESTYVTKVHDFTDDRTIKTYIESLDAFGGGDFAQAVHDGLLVAARDLTWRNYPMIPSLRYIFHVADAPPHGKQFEQGQNNGCTCGISTDAVTHAINHQQIHYRLIKINAHPHLNKMEQIFKKSMTNFESAQIKHAREMNIKVSDMIIREIMPL